MPDEFTAFLSKGDDDDDDDDDDNDDDDDETVSGQGQHPN